MTNAWNHCISLIPPISYYVGTDHETETVIRETLTAHESFVRGKLLCSMRGCTGEPIYETGYNYVTGRAGRVSRQQRYACANHGAQFAEKHGLELPLADAPERSEP